MDAITSISINIKNSFRDVMAPPKENEILLGYEPDNIAFISIIRDKSWLDFLQFLEAIDIGEAIAYCEMWILMTDAAYYYYSPAILTFSLKPAADIISMLICSQMYTYPGDPFAQIKEQRVSLFSSAQRRAIAQAIEYYLNSSPDVSEIRTDLLTYFQRWLEL